MKPRILVIGYGAIGRPLVSNLVEEGRFELALWSAAPVEFSPVDRLVHSLEDVDIFAPDLVVECAGQEVVRTLIPSLLSRGFPTVIVSVGALADENVLGTIEAAAAHGARFIVPAGAIGGMDYLGTVKGDPSLKVEYTSRKPVHVWAAELESRGVNAAELTEAYTIFSGPASAAALAYPRNLNVAATLALNSIGMEQTRVTVLADPNVTRNTHEIYVQGNVGSACFQFENVPSASNPNTSALTEKSLLWEIRRFFHEAGKLPGVGHDH